MLTCIFVCVLYAYSHVCRDMCSDTSPPEDQMSSLIILHFLRLIFLFLIIVYGVWTHACNALGDPRHQVPWSWGGRLL